eukprot:CAMPEP_0203665446 /NCGR_PEP_ID=MMETSP0090-20130426/2655_1 /ASSEMBLY_ACC=CAM_ASM_001088 /TAXON_ID=426623 /ORGANISM="Chaetoceros affinis, Strain CCMP159" /LENGTH=670 /DNA_ID=CAMNT_0050528999 /DNA_START=62 /DNA_END=2074 /DNA_ORIENTATION=+
MTRNSVHRFRLSLVQVMLLLLCNNDDTNNIVAFSPSFSSRISRTPTLPSSTPKPTSTPKSKSTPKSTCWTALAMAGGEGGESEWKKALEENKGRIPGQFDLELAKALLEKSTSNPNNSNNSDSESQSESQSSSPKPKSKMAGLNPNSKSSTNAKLSANANLISWLETASNGEVYLSDASGWGEAPHPMAISTDTVDELTNESSGRGLLARRSINMEEVLLTIPLKLCITKQSALDCFTSQAVNNGLPLLDSTINEYMAIACQLIHENFVLGQKESFYGPYLGVLPLVDEVNPTFTWSDEDLAALDGSPVVAATKSMQMKLQREYDDLLGGKGKLCDLYPDYFPREHFTYKNWVWAFTMLFSRAIRLRNLKNGEALALVPYADLINHSPYSQAYLDAREKGDWLFKTGTEEVVLYADRSYRKMEQIYISYGPKSNADLLLLYGFALERNPFNSVDVTVSIKSLLGSVTQSENANNDDSDSTSTSTSTFTDPLAEEKMNFLRRAGRDTTVDFPCYADRYPTEMLEYLRLMMMTPEDTRGRPLSDFDYTRTISAANEAQVFSSVVAAVKKQLSLYPTTEEQDAAIIKDRGMFRLLSYNQRMAVRHRRNEKRLLKRTVAALERQIRSRGLDGENLDRAEGSTLGVVLPGEKDTVKQRTPLEDRFDRMGLPIDLR